jgi:hypothetical protein
MEPFKKGLGCCCALHVLKVIVRGKIGKGKSESVSAQSFETVVDDQLEMMSSLVDSLRIFN